MTHYKIKVIVPNQHLHYSFKTFALKLWYLQQNKEHQIGKGIYNY